jgi:predicted dehydrogenase
MEQGSESEHPIPEFLYKKGGGPLFDFGPYYITALVNLLGPVKRVCALSAITFKERIATCEDQAVRVIPVEVPTHVAGTLEFTCGALITMVMSFDVWHHSNHPIEIHGEKGSLKVPDPNIFGGPVYLNKPGDEGWQSVSLSHGYTDQMRIIGVADMAFAIRGNRKNRCNGELAYHVLDVMESLIESSTNGKYILVESTTERPAPLPLGLEGGELDG